MLSGKGRPLDYSIRGVNVKQRLLDILEQNIKAF